MAASEGSAIQLSGPTLQAVLEIAGVRFGDKLVGNRLAAFVTVEGLNGQRMVFSLPEIDTSHARESVILAIARNGAPLYSAEGPFWIVVQGDDKQRRWVKNVSVLWVLHTDDAIDRR